MVDFVEFGTVVCCGVIECGGVLCVAVCCVLCVAALNKRSGKKTNDNNVIQIYSLNIH